MSRSNSLDDSTVLLDRTKKKTILKKPGKYAVVLLNDDYTPRDFVVWILQSVFRKSMPDAERIMVEAHTKGKSIIGIYSLDIAKTYVAEVRDLADINDFPLECRVEATKE
jgi:ATP-dependent Clp protease adaptor protein ClpS